MKIGRFVFGLVVMFGITAIFGTAPLRAQSKQMFANPLNAKIPHGKRPLAGTPNDAIVTESGPLKGIQIWGGDGYFGIPYAAPPVGSLRWRPPQPHAKWQGVFQANNYGNFCTQPDGFGGAFGSEDCLTLDIFRPHQKKNQNKQNGLPVMVWIHGGGLVTGNSFFYKPSPLALNGNVVEVNVNYRLGYLGFFAHPAIDGEGHLNGNYGLMDQQLALKWVQRNIAAFGGDPNAVTVFGESAGGQSVYSQLVSPTAAGLFQRAISQSGAYFEFQDYFNDIVPLAQGETGFGTGAVPSGTFIAANAGCANQTAQCLRAVSASILASAEPATVYPFVDGTILTQTPSAAFATGQFNRVPVISGGNHDEERIYVARQYDFTGNPLLTEAEYDNAVIAAYPPGFGATFVLPLYPYASYPSGGVALAASETDVVFACAERNAVRSLSQYVTTYAYEFNDENAPDLFDPIFLATFPLGAYHFAEVPYLFDLDLRFAGFNPFTTDQQQLSNTMISYWTQFATTGDPNSPGTPVWLPYHSTVDQFQSLVPPSPIAESGFDADHKCSSFWSSF
jgi:para-nitrobenzyl esterase